jgi:DNA-binding Lrp family transcriptional regulator
MIKGTNHQRPSAEGHDSEASPPTFVEGARARAELPVILLATGYNLRMLNALRARFEGRAERAALPMLLCLSARLADVDPPVAGAARQALQGIFSEWPPDAANVSLRQIEEATGFPRETLRRSARRLEERGWITRTGQNRLTATLGFADCLFDAAERARLQDFRWTAARIRELSEPGTLKMGATLREALAAMRACRSSELAGRLRWELPVQPAPALLASALVLMHGHNLRHLLTLAPYFDGDLLLAVTLGEVAHRNIAALSSQPGGLRGDSEDLIAALKLERPQETIFTDPTRGMNAHSLAACLEVPYETMRRKLAELVERGFLQRDAGGLYWLRSHVPEVFRTFNAVRRADLLATAETIEALLRQGSA